MISRRLWAMLAILALIAGAVFAAEKKKKKKKEDVEPPTQVLELPKEPPTAIAGDVDRLTFRVTPLSGKGLLSQQVRDGVKDLLRDSPPPLKIRAFVAGSGDLRRVPNIISEVFTDRHLQLPVVSVVQVGALPLTGAQVVLESTSAARKPVNPGGLVFLANQEEAVDKPLDPIAPLVSRSLDRLKASLAAAGAAAEGMLRVTCFATSLDNVDQARALIYAAFPRAVVNYVQFVRAPNQTIATCEGVGRLSEPPGQAVRVFSRPGSEAADAVAVASGRITMSGIQLGFGTQEADIRLAFDRLDKALESARATRANTLLVNIYSLSRSAATRLRQERERYFDKTKPIIYNLFLSEGLASLDASFGVEVAAVAP
ncbi:MAG: hypothetical protein NTY38_04590 [Acidobacteria bacterium]|nr:hypothetical protein [Acidobacteriota bacterium]